MNGYAPNAGFESIEIGTFQMEEESAEGDRVSDDVEHTVQLDKEALDSFIWEDFGVLLAVRHDDESKFTPEEWAEILELIEQGEMRWQD